MYLLKKKILTLTMKIVVIFLQIKIELYSLVEPIIICYVIPNVFRDGTFCHDLKFFIQLYTIYGHVNKLLCSNNLLFIFIQKLRNVQWNKIILYTFRCTNVHANFKKSAYNAILNILVLRYVLHNKYIKENSKDETWLKCFYGLVFCHRLKLEMDLHDWCPLLLI